MICTQCGSSNTEGARFCNDCGAGLDRSSQKTEVLVSPPVPSANSSQPQDKYADHLIGKIIESKYRLDSKLGVGGMGTVYRATRLLIGDEVAIKILHDSQLADDPHTAERFRREAQAAARLKHPNAVSVYDFGVSSEGLQYLGMELVEGQSLRQIVKQHGPLGLPTTEAVISQVCAALDEAHRQHIVHRDIKPDNIIINVREDRTQVKVLDFGIAKLRDQSASNLTQTGSVMGTPYYMSPEQCLGEELDSRSDIYSLGIVLYEMLCGVVPFNSPTSTAVVIQHVNQAPPSLSMFNVSIPSAIEAVVMHALEKRPEARPQTARALAQELTAAIHHSDGNRGVSTYARSSWPNAGGMAVSDDDEATVVRDIAATQPAFGSPTTGSAPTIHMTNAPRISGAITSHGSQPFSANQTPAYGSSKKYPALLLAGAALLLLSISAAAWLLLRDNKEQSGTNSASSVNQARDTEKKSDAPSAASPSAVNPPPRITVTASSFLPAVPGATYKPSNIIDGDLKTAWVEGVPGPGINEWVRFDFNREVILDHITITPGYFKGRPIWARNNRLAAATFYFSDGSSQQFRFADRMEKVTLNIESRKTNWVRLVVDEVYFGIDPDTPISEMTFDVKEEESSSNPASTSSTGNAALVSPSVEESLSATTSASHGTEGTWYVVLGSYPKFERQKADERLSQLQRLGYDARIVDTDNYPKMRSGLWAVVMGPYSKEYAREQTNKLRSVIPDAYLK